MGRLAIWLHGKLAGHLERGEGNVISLTYTREWHEAWLRREAHAISISLPVSGPETRLDATAYVAGLLPDSLRHRDLIAEELGIGDDPSDFAFLSKMGRDSAGALTIIPEGLPPRHDQAPGIDWLDEAGVAAHLRALPRRPLLISEEEGIVLSLAGVNDKAAVVVKKDRIGLPRHGHPSTHIIKVDIPGLKDSVKTEHFCLSLARATGMRVPQSRLLRAEDQDFMLMGRYDRRIDEAGRLVRVHQEDFCQALNVRPAKKYQRYGGPGWPDAFALMRHTVNPVEARMGLLRMAIFQFLSGNPDAHAKNYSLIYRGNTAIELAPIYDLNNAAAFRANFKATRPIMAMWIGEEANRDEVGPEDWDVFAKQCGLRAGFVRSAITDMASRILTMIDDVVAAMPDCEAIRISAEDIRERCLLWGGKDLNPRDGLPGPG